MTISVTCLARVILPNGFEEELCFKLEKINGEYWWCATKDVDLLDVTIILDRKFKISVGVPFMFKFEEGDL